MSLVVVGSMAFDAIETPFGKSDKIIGGAATYIAWSASNFTQPIKQLSVVGGDFPKDELHMLEARGVVTEGVDSGAITSFERVFMKGGGGLPEDATGAYTGPFKTIVMVSFREGDDGTMIPVREMYEWVGPSKSQGTWKTY